MDDQDTSASEQMSRQNFLKSAIAAIGGIITLGMVIPAIGYIVGPALQRRQAQDSIRLGSTSKVDDGEPTLFKVNIEQKTGWITSEEEISVYVYTDNGRDYVALSNVCTHLGCRVRWVSEQQEFFCPCHNGVFAKDGDVVSGPPPRPLDQYDVTVDNGQLFITGG